MPPWLGSELACAMARGGARPTPPWAEGRALSAKGAGGAVSPLRMTTPESSHGGVRSAHREGGGEERERCMSKLECQGGRGSAQHGAATGLGKREQGRDDARRPTIRLLRPWLRDLRHAIVIKCKFKLCLASNRRRRVMEGHARQRSGFTSPHHWPEK
jgi:hypothetical protein